MENFQQKPTKTLLMIHHIEYFLLISLQIMPLQINNNHLIQIQ